MMHDLKSGSSDDQDTDNDDCLSPGSPYRQFILQTESPLPQRHPASPTPVHTQMDSSESDAESTTLSPDFPKFRPGLIPHHVTDDSTTSPDFPKFKPGLLSQGNPNDHSSSTGSKDGSLTQDTSPISPDFPKFRPGLLSPHHDEAASLEQSDTKSAAISPDFPKFRPGLLCGDDYRSVTSPRLQSSVSRTKSPQAEVISNPTTPSSSSGYVTPHLKCPLSPLARTSAHATSPNIRSILKPVTAGPVLPTQQSRAAASPLRRRVLQHNLLLRESADSTTHCSCKETGEDRHNIQANSEPTTSPVVPELVYLPPTPPRDHGPFGRRNDFLERSEIDSTSPSTASDHLHVHFESGELPDGLVFVNQACAAHLEDKEDDGQEKTTSPQLTGLATPQTPPTSHPRPSSGTPLHSPCQDDRPSPLKVSSVSPMSQSNVPNRYRRRKSVTFEGTHSVIHRSPSQLTRSRQSPLSPSRSRYYRRRKSISTTAQVQTMREQHSVHKLTPSPHLPSHIYRKVSLSPIDSHRPKVAHSRSPHTHIKVPSPHLPTHIYRNVPMTPLSYRRRKSVSIVTNHGEAYPSHSRHGKRRRSVSIMTHNASEGGHQRTSLHLPHHIQRRRSVPHGEETSTQTRQEGLSTLPEKEYGTSTNSEKTTSVSSHCDSEGVSHHHRSSRYQRRRRSDSILSQQEIKSRFYKRRKSISGHHHQHLGFHNPGAHLPVHVYSQNQQQLPTITQSPSLPRNDPSTPINNKRRKSITSIGQNHTTSNGNCQTLTPAQSPFHFPRRSVPPPLTFGWQRRRKSVLVINRDNHLIPVTSPLVNRISLTAYQRSLPTTPLPRRYYARRMSLSSVITPRPRRRVETDEQIQVTMEAARFDVTSIYSAKSFLSLAPHRIASGKSGIERQDDSEDEIAPELLEEEKGEGSISMKLYYKFFRAGGSVLLLLATIAIFVFGEVSDSCGNYP